MCRGSLASNRAFCNFVVQEVHGSLLNQRFEASEACHSKHGLVKSCRVWWSLGRGFLLILAATHTIIVCTKLSVICDQLAISFRRLQLQ